MNADALNAPIDYGESYDDVVPDTLELADHAHYGLNYFSELIDEDLDHEMYFGGDLTHFYNHVTSFGACQCKAAEAMCYERLMTGSTLHVDREDRMLKKLLSYFGDDGLHWVSEDVIRHPWFEMPEPFVMVHGQGRMLRAMIAWHQYTGAPIWAEMTDKLAEGLDRIVIHKEDYAYFPIFGHYKDEYLRSCYVREGWGDTREPANEKDGEEGSLFNHQGHLPGALATWYSLTGNEQALDLSGQLARFLAKPKFWDFLDDAHGDLVGSDHALWSGHMHGHVNALRAILEYALASNDRRLKEFVRDGYEWTRKFAFARIGLVGDGQGCGAGRLVGLAIKLSDAGIGDYWEDVDQYIRNLGTRQQFQPEYTEFVLDTAAKQTAPEPAPDKTFDRVPDRLIGAFAGRSSMVVHWLCCGAHGNMGLFYAWDGIVRFDDATDTARVNLLLNRASPWLDVHSHLPYAGKVRIVNKTARELFIRVPLWVDKGAVVARVREQERAQTWFGNYLRLGDVGPGDEITVEFPMVHQTETRILPFPGGRNESWAVPGTGPLEDLPQRREHRCEFKGNTVVQMSPDIFPGSPVFRRAYLRADNAPMKTVTRYVSPQRLAW